MTLEEKTTGTNLIFQGRVINLRLDTILLPNGKDSTREIIEHRGAVAMVPLLPGADPNNPTIVLVKQYRQAAGQVLLEIPAGTRGQGEDPLLCAQRELAEEINFSAGRMVKLFEAYMAPGYTTELIHFFAALDMTPAEGHTDEDEFVEIVHLSLSEAIVAIQNGTIIDAKSICGLLYVERMLPNLLKANV